MAKHSFEFKKKVVLEYLLEAGGTSYLSKKYDFGSNTQLRKWVNDFRVASPDALRPKKKGRKKTLHAKGVHKTSSPTEIKDTTIDTSAEHVKELEDELLKLQIENAF